MWSEEAGDRDWPRGLVHSKRLEALMGQNQDRMERSGRQYHVTREALGPRVFQTP